jgi:hypothetical protein
MLRYRSALAWWRHGLAGERLSLALDRDRAGREVDPLGGHPEHSPIRRPARPSATAAR